MVRFHKKWGLIFQKKKRKKEKRVKRYLDDLTKNEGWKMEKKLIKVEIGRLFSFLFCCFSQRVSFKNLSLFKPLPLPPSIMKIWFRKSVMNNPIVVLQFIKFFLHWAIWWYEKNGIFWSCLNNWIHISIIKSIMSISQKTKFYRRAGSKFLYIKHDQCGMF